MAKTNGNAKVTDGSLADDSAGDAVNPESLTDRIELGIIEQSEQPDTAGTGIERHPEPSESDVRYERQENGLVVRNTDGTPRKKRGRKPAGNGETAGTGTGTGSGSAPKRTYNKTREKTLVESIDSLSIMIGAVHFSLASLTGYETLALDDKESQSLAKATVNLAEQFEYKPNPKLEAMFSFAAVSASIYGPRIVLIKMEQSEKRKVKLATAGIDMPGKPQAQKSAPNNDILTLAEIQAMQNG